MSNVKDADGNTAAMRAAVEGNMAALKEQIAAGVDLNLKNNDGKTAAMLAAGSGNAEALKEMKRGPSLANIATADGGTPAMSACCHGKLEALQVRISGFRCRHSFASRWLKVCASFRCYSHLIEGLRFTSH